MQLKDAVGIKANNDLYVTSLPISVSIVPTRFELMSIDSCSRPTEIRTSIRHLGEEKINTCQTIILVATYCIAHNNKFSTYQFSAAATRNRFVDEALLGGTGTSINLEIFI
jgi:hypothetical protein